MPAEVSKLSSTILRDPVRIEVTPQATTVERIDQRVLFVEKKDKDELLLELLRSEHLQRVLIFTRTKHGANKLAIRLNKENIRADAIHGDKSQSARTLALKRFRNGNVRVLVATDIAARGIDIDEISHVINFEIPNEAENYVHRIGRTARAGAEGTAYSLCAPDERDLLRQIERVTRQQLPVMEHRFHSERAQNATGAAARQPPRGGGQFHRRGPARPQGGHQGGRGGGRPGERGRSSGGGRGRFSGKPKPAGSRFRRDR